MMDTAQGEPSSITLILTAEPRPGGSDLRRPERPWSGLARKGLAIRDAAGAVRARAWTGRGLPAATISFPTKELRGAELLIEKVGSLPGPRYVGPPDHAAADAEPSHAGIESGDRWAPSPMTYLVRNLEEMAGRRVALRWVDD